MRKFETHQIETREQIKMRFELLGLIKITSQVYGNGPYNVVKAIEEFDLGHRLANHDPDGSVWFDNDNAQELEDHLSELEGLKFIDLDYREDDQFSNRFLANITDHGSRYLSEFYDGNFSSVSASNRYVSRKDNQKSWNDAVASLDHVIAEFKEDQQTFGNEVEHEKNALIQTLEAGRDFLNHEVIKIQMGIVLLLEPLKIVRTRVEDFVAKHSRIADGLTVAVITKAIDAISKLLFGV